VSTNPPTGQQPDKNRFGKQIDDAFADAAKLAGSTLAPAEFYERFLNTAITAIGAPAGAVWLRTPQGFLQVACQLNLDKVGLDAKRGGRQCHNEILRQVFQAQPPRPVSIEPQGQVSGLAEAGPVPARNLTEFFTLFAPIVQQDKTAMGLLEIFQDPTHDPRMYPTFLNFAVQMAGYASQYHTFTNTRQAAGLDKVYTQVESFARMIHGTLNPTECAYHVANEGRRLVECDRMCVGVRHGKKVTVEAVSGADVVEKAATHIRRMRALFDAVLTWGDKLVFKGEKDESLPPAVLNALDDYLAESQPKLLIVQPIRDEREKDEKKPARSVLLIESFNPPENIEPLIQKLEIVGKHAAPALYNAAEMKSIPLKTIWWPIKKIQDGLGGKARLIGFSIAAALIALTLAMIFVPYQLKMDAKGELQPKELYLAYPTEAGKLREIKYKPGVKVTPGAVIAEMFSDEIGQKFNEVIQEIRTKRAGYQVQLATNTNNFTPSELANHLQQLSVNKAQIEGKETTRDQMIRDYNLDPQRPGFMNVRAPKLDPSKVPADAKFTVLNADNSNEMVNRILRPSDAIQKLGYSEGEWHIQVKVPQRNLGHVLKAFTNPKLSRLDDKGKKFLDVDLIVTSESDTKYYGRLYEDDLAREVVPNKDDHNESEPVSIGYIKIDWDGIPENRKIPRTLFVSGQETKIVVRCGDHALGYSLFHGVWEWFYEKVIFFF
jgi:hypothetical protein